MVQGGFFNCHFMKTTVPSLWYVGQEMPHMAELAKNLTVDVCVIGAGISGLTTAYFLLQEGKSVLVVDKNQIGSGETGQTSAHLSNALDEHYSQLEILFGKSGARLAAESHTTAISMIESIVHKEKIDCQFERIPGYLFHDKVNKPDLNNELAAAYRAGLENVRLVQRAPLPKMSERSVLVFPDQAQFQPLHYLVGLAHAVKLMGGEIYGDTTVTELIEKNDSVEVTTLGGHKIQCQSVVVATNSPFNDRVKIHTKQAAYRSYVIGIPVPKNSVEKALYWDTEDPYHYVRVASAASGEEDFLIVGGEDHKTGQDHAQNEHYENLYAWAKQYFEVTKPAMFQWSGQVMEPIDGLAYIGLNPGDKRTFVVTGDSGHGLTHGTIAGRLLTDLICGRENSWTALYSPARKNIKAAGTFFTEGMNTALQYTHLLRPEAAVDEAQLALEQGAVVNVGMKKVAIYRDSDGQLLKYSAICPHLGCVVQWNNTEKSFDCPCHGSRFDCHGKVLNGPATTDLPSV